MMISIQSPNFAECTFQTRHPHTQTTQNNTSTFQLNNNIMAPSKPLNTYADADDADKGNDNERSDRHHHNCHGTNIGFETILVTRNRKQKQLHRNTILPLSSPPRLRSLPAANTLALDGNLSPASSKHGRVHQNHTSSASASTSLELEVKGALPCPSKQPHHSTILPHSSSSPSSMTSASAKGSRSVVEGSTSPPSNTSSNMHNHQASVDKLKGTWPALPKDDYCQPNEVGGGSELDDDDEFIEPSDFNDNVADDIAMHMNSTTTNAPSHFICSMTKKWNVIWMIAAVAFALLFGTGLGLPLGLVMRTKTYRQQQSETYAATPKSHSSKRDSDRCASKGNKSKGEGGAKSTKAKGKKSTSKSPSSSRGAMKATKVKGSHNKSTKRPSKSKSPTVCAPSPNPTPEPTSTPSPSTSCAYVNAPSSSIATKIKDLIVLQDISDLIALNDETSPQGCAFKWITDGDPINPPLRPGCDDAQIIQRYIDRKSVV